MNSRLNISQQANELTNLTSSFMKVIEAQLVATKLLIWYRNKRLYFVISVDVFIMEIDSNYTLFSYRCVHL
jgi:hypothetical protein